MMRRDGIGRPRAGIAERRLREFNPIVDVEAVAENVNENNVSDLVSRVDIVFDCAPLYEERLLMNRECVRQGKPMIECAVWGMEGQVTTVLPGRTPCLACLCPPDPSCWKRRFPIFGAISTMAAALGVAEAIKLVAGMGPSLPGKLLYFDLRRMEFQTMKICRRADCDVCGPEA